MKIVTNFCLYLGWVFLKLEILQIKYIEKIKTLILYSTMFLEELDTHEIMWKILWSRTDHMTIWRRMRIACWITKATNTISE
jgi:hypothetical protein